MPAIHEPMNLGDLLKYEAPNLYSRELGTVAAGELLLLGTVLGRETATGKLKALDPNAEGDGTEIAVAVLAGDVDATLIDRADALVIARHAILASGALQWPGDISPAQRAAALAQLEARGILVRQGA